MAGTTPGRPTIARVRRTGRSRLRLSGAAPDSPGATLVLRERESGEERRVGLAPAGDRLAVLDLTHPWPLASWRGVWDGVVEADGHRTPPAVALDAASRASMLVRDVGLACRVRAAARPPPSPAAPGPPPAGPAPRTWSGRCAPWPRSSTSASRPTAPSSSRGA